MKYKTLGKSGVQVSELCFGTMTFAKEADEAESARMFRRCREAGINFFDCANNYSDGQAEIILGKLIGDCRNEVVITTKVSQRTGADVNAKGASRRNIMLEVDKSLSRLNTDRIDFYIIHYFDPFTPFEVTLRALDDLVSQGKILYLGVSNCAAWQIAKALGISDKYGFSRFELVQPMYNLVKRQAEVEILPLAESEQLGVIAYNPLGAGILSGKYSKNSRPQVGRIVEQDTYGKRYSDPRYYQVAEDFLAYANELGVSPVTLAISWVKANPAITAPIIGARNVGQLEASLAAAQFNMTAEIYEKIAKMSIQPGNATDRLEEVLDQKYKFSNR